MEFTYKVQIGNEPAIMDITRIVAISDVIKKEEVVKKDENGKPVLDENKKPVSEIVECKPYYTIMLDNGNAAGMNPEKVDHDSLCASWINALRAKYKGGCNGKG